MSTALIIGGTGFVGHHTVAEFHDHGYDVAVLSRGVRSRPAEPRADVSYLEGDRTDPATLERVAERVDPEVVVDCAAFHPQTVHDATSVFSDGDAYLYVSSGGVYARDDIPKREETTPLHSFGPEHAGDDTIATYGPRKAECDRLVRDAADEGVAAMCVRPTMVYGPKPASDDGSSAGAISWAADFPGAQTHHDYWIDRVNRYDRVVVPGDGTAIWHRAYVEDVARALRVVAEEGTPGAAYNVADRRVLTLEDVVELVAETLDTGVDIVHASRRELDQVGLEPDDFVLYHHIGRNYPHVLSTCTLASLGWESTPVETAMRRTVEESLTSGRDGHVFDPGRKAEERLIDAVAG